jgi:hypothetical protein
VKDNFKVNDEEENVQLVSRIEVSMDDGLEPLRKNAGHSKKKKKKKAVV